MYSVRNLLTIFLFIFSTYSFLFNASTKDLSKCKTHLSRGELSYNTFFQITNSLRNANSSLTLDFHFGVQAPSDAHILLSPSTKISTLDPVYEIVLGAGGNTFADLRRLQKQGTRISKIQKDLLSFTEIRWFWLHISQDGFIQVGREGENLAFLSWRDTSPLPIQVYSFSSWTGIEALWYFDCAKEDNSTPTSEEILPILTAREKLKKLLFTHYDPYVRPNTYMDDFVIIHLGLNYERIILDEMNSKLIIDGKMQLQWLDENILWDPKEFDNIESLNLVYREIWLPDLILYNSASGPGTDFLKSTNILINSQGWVTWLTQVHMESWCDASGLGHWPNDQHMCEIQLGFWVQEKYLLLEASSTNASVVKKPYSEWEIINIEDGHDSLPTPWNIESDSYSNIFVMRFTLQRTTNVYTTVYFTPVIAISISLLVSFWVQPIGPYRTYLYCFQLIILSAFLTKLATNVPAHPKNIPYLVCVYVYLFIATLLALIFSVININWNYKKHTKPIPYFVYKFLSLNFMKSILYVNSKFSESYSKIADEREQNKIDINETWVLLGIALDRLLFVIYFVLTIVFLSREY